MWKKLIAMTVMCLMLCGCGSWMDGSYHSVSLHEPQGDSENQQIPEVNSYYRLRMLLEDTVESGKESLVFSATGYNKETLSVDMDRAISYVVTNVPVGAYAVEAITYDQSAVTGRVLISVTIAYNSNQAKISQIRQAKSMAEARQAAYDAVEQAESVLVMQVGSYQDTDFIQLIQSYGDEHPESVMEVPQVVSRVYPDSGRVRIVELQFIYQTSRETLLSMQGYVQPIFNAAKIYIQGDSQDSTKYNQLYTYLMERYDYTMQGSITPSYSLLRYGVGDSKACASVYSAMCRDSQLECMVVSGTMNGEARYWNIIREGERYYHVDLASSSISGELVRRLDSQMEGYVWDYSAYPACVEEEILPVSETNPASGNN